MRRFVVCCFVSCGFICGQTATTAEVGNFPGTIRGIVEQAKRAGKTTADVPFFSSDYPHVSTLADALRLTTPVAVHVLSKKTTLSQDGDRLLTIYTVRVIDNISSVSLLGPFAKPDPAILPPSEFDASASDSVYVLIHGGTILIDGVTVDLPEKPASLVIGGEYLLFLRFEKSREGMPTRLATVPIGEAGVFEYDTSTDTVIPISGKHNRDLASTLMSKSSGLYSLLRSTIVAAEPPAR